jgi:hypothetical protein
MQQDAPHKDKKKKRKVALCLNKTHNNVEAKLHSIIAAADTAPRSDRYPLWREL